LLEKEQAIWALADRRERFDTPLSLPKDWIILCDDDDLCNMSMAAAKALLARTKKRQRVDGCTLARSGSRSLSVARRRGRA